MRWPLDGGDYRGTKRSSSTGSGDHQRCARHWRYWNNLSASPWDAWGHR